MQTNITYNQLIELIKQFTQQHLKINSFGHGDLWEIENWKDINYPLLWVVNTPVTTISNNTVNFSLQVIVMDLVKKDESNETDVLSDTQQILLDFHTHFSRNLDYPFSIQDEPSMSAFTERFDSEVSGWGMDIVFQVEYNSNVCAIPGVNPNGTFVPTPVNTIIDVEYLTCNTLQNCQTIINIENNLNNLQQQIDNLPTTSQHNDLQGLNQGDYLHLTQNEYNSLLNNTLYTWTNTSTFTQGQKFIWQSPHGDLRSYVVRPGQTLNPGETPFTHPQKVQRIGGDKIVNAQTSILRVTSNQNQSQKVVIRQSDGKIFATNINTTTNQRVDIRDYDPVTFASIDVTTINIGYTIRDMIYVESLDEVWVCANNNYITRINANTNTIIGSINSFLAAPAGTVLEMFDSSSNYVYVHYLDGTNRIARIDKNTLTTTLIITGTLNNNTVNGIFYEAGNCIYAMNLGYRFIIYDLTNLTETIIYDTLNLALGTISSEIIGNKLYLGVNHRFITVYDITNPTSPVLLNEKIGIRRARALKYNPKTNNLYVLTSNQLVLDGTYISVVDLTTNKVVDSHIIDNNYNKVIFLYQMAIHNLGNFVAVPYVTNNTQGNKIFIF